MATDQSVLNYTTLKDIVENYSSTDGNAQWIWAARILDRMCPMMRILPMVESNNVLSNVATRTDFLPAPANRQFFSISTINPNPVLALRYCGKTKYESWKAKTVPL